MFYFQLFSEKTILPRFHNLCHKMIIKYTVYSIKRTHVRLILHVWLSLIHIILENLNSKNNFETKNCPKVYLFMTIRKICHFSTKIWFLKSEIEPKLGQMRCHKGAGTKMKICSVGWLQLYIKNSKSVLKFLR